VFVGKLGPQDSVAFLGDLPIGLPAATLASAGAAASQKFHAFGISVKTIYL